MNLKIKSINQVENFILYRKWKLYKSVKTFNSPLYLDKLATKKVVFIEFFYYENARVKKQLFLGVCVKVSKRGLSSSVVLRNILGSVIVEQQFLVFNTKIISIRNSKRYNLRFKKSKLYFLNNLPQFYRINQVALKETYFYKKKLKKIKKKKK